ALSAAGLADAPERPVAALARSDSVEGDNSPGSPVSPAGLPLATKPTKPPGATNGPPGAARRNLLPRPVPPGSPVGDEVSPVSSFRRRWFSPTSRRRRRRRLEKSRLRLDGRREGAENAPARPKQGNRVRARIQVRRRRDTVR